MERLIEEDVFEKARKKIREEKKEKVIFSSYNDDLNRKILEKENIGFLMLRQAGKRDFQKQRNSGLNQVLARIAKEKNIGIGIDLDEIIESNKKEKAEIIARIKQNIKLCNRYKLRMVFISKKNYRDIYDLRALGALLGMPTWMTKQLKILKLKS